MSTVIQSNCVPFVTFSPCSLLLRILVSVANLRNLFFILLCFIWNNFGILGICLRRWESKEKIKITLWWLKCVNWMILFGSTYGWVFAARYDEVTLFYKWRLFSSVAYTRFIIRTRTFQCLLLRPGAKTFRNVRECDCIPVYLSKIFAVVRTYAKNFTLCTPVRKCFSEVEPGQK